MLLYSLTIFLSAFLLFLVQPLIGRYVLPWFGGSVAVWTTCLLFFQTFLVGGYAYAHALIRYASPGRQRLIHLLLLVAALATLPITPAASWKPTGAEPPVWRIVLLLASSVGMPYLLLSATGPLLQAWFSRAWPGRPPYRLYALSNVGSFLALLSYPVLVEPRLRLTQQTHGWSLGFAAFAALCALVAWGAGRLPAPAQPTADETAARPTGGLILLWLLLAACGSALLMAITNQICQDVAAVPFLWVLPLSLYLLSFVICFEREAWYVRPLWTTLLAVTLGAAGVALLRPLEFSLAIIVLIFAGLLFAACVVCHGELARLKPAPRHLTLFYLTMSAGGAVGGGFVALLAPVVFRNHWELDVALLVCCGLLAALGLRELNQPPADPRARSSAAALASMGALGFLSVCWLWGVQVRTKATDARATVRNFYGVLRVLDRDPDKPAERRFILYNGQIMHGLQYQAADRRAVPTSYYGRDSGLGVACGALRRLRGGPLRIGCIGLGTGSLAVYADAGDLVGYYEINRLVVDVSEQWFTYLRDARARGADTRIFLGDARLVMEQQLAGGEPLRFDVLAVDAFTGDAIPVHLLTREAMALYQRHLAPDGVLAVHVSNRYLRLAPVVRRLAAEAGLVALLYDRPGSDADLTSSSEWVLVTRNPRFLLDDTALRYASDWPPDAPAPLWSDDYSNLWQVLAR